MSVSRKATSSTVGSNPVYISPYGGPSVTISAPPSALTHTSKINEKLQYEGSGLDRKKKFLQEQAIIKDKLFKEETVRLESRMRVCGEIIEKEKIDREADFEALTKKFSTLLNACLDEIETELEASYTVIDHDYMRPQQVAMDKLDERFDRAFHDIIPKEIEAKNQPPIKQLIKSQELFEIDNTKLLRREEEIVNRQARHEKYSASCLFELERKRTSNFLVLTEDFYDQERNADFAEEAHQNRSLQSVQSVDVMGQGLAGERQAMDADILQAIEDSSQHFEQIILHNFGYQVGLVMDAADDEEERYSTTEDTSAVADDEHDSTTEAAAD